jgi:DNA-binding NarL/FixJ family response regulator
VFRLLVTGMSVTQIGAQLGLAPNTVSTYRARVLEKTGTRNDVELALYAQRLAPSPSAR